MNPTLQHRFQYHPPKTVETISAHEHTRELCGALAQQLDEWLPEGREKALAMTKIEEAMFWANAAIARA